MSNSPRTIRLTEIERDGSRLRPTGWPNWRFKTKTMQMLWDRANERFKSVKILSSRIQMRFRYRAELADHYLTLASICNAMGQQPQTCDAFRNAIDSYRMLATKNASYAGLMRASQYGNYCLEHSEFEEAVTVWRPTQADC